MTSDLARREADFFDAHWQQTVTATFADDLVIPGVPTLRNASILICSCGSGREPVQAANAGARVFAFDISPKAVEQALIVASHNGKQITAEVMDFSALAYPDHFFDVVYGSYILHHVDCDSVGREVRRCLKPGGVAFFWENSDRNAILRIARRAMFGPPGGRQKSRFLCFSREGTSDEYPLTEDEVAVIGSHFAEMTRVYTQFAFFRLLVRHGWRNERFGRAMSRLDDAVVRLFPRLMKYSFYQGILLRAPDA